MTHLINHGEFTLHSKKKSNFKIDCDALTDEDLDAAVKIFIPRLSHFSKVWGIPTGGSRLAEAFKPYKSDVGGLLLVDDVWTTGESMRKYYEDNTQGVVLFSRSELPRWVRSLFMWNL